ncbi:MAG: DUF2254 domain-containing protein [Thermoleophilia bacterium]|nr:DUF2254 domain-containing protein [Thermoleophilia bacterium]
MLAALRLRWRSLARGFWFVPSSVALLFVALAFALLEADEAAGERGADFAFGGDAEAARQILAIIAASLITVAGVSFSITIVTLQLVSSQYTPRALRTFLKDRTTQVTAGVFVGVFLYCLTVLRAIRDDSRETAAFVPSLGVTAGIVLAAAGLALLLLFIHHMGESIKVSTIVARIGRDTLRAIDELYPDRYDGRGEDADAAPTEEPQRDGEPALVRAARAGYVQAIDAGSLARALPDGACVELKIRAGDFTTKGTPIAAIWPAGAVGDRVRLTAEHAVRLDDDRDIAQDVAYGVRQLADIALRAISPGVNDPTTAINCVRYLQAAVAVLAGRSLTNDARAVDAGTVLLAPVRPFASYVEQAFLELGRYATRDARVAIALLDALAAVAESAREAGADERVDVVVEVADAVAGPALDDARTDYDRALIEEHADRVRRPVAPSERAPGSA